MKSKLVLALISCSALCASANAQNGCGDPVNWTSPTCQVIGAGRLDTAIVNGINDPNAWTVISRHGEYMQNETECNLPANLQVVSDAGCLDGKCLAITTAASATTCGDFNASTGAVHQTTPSTPYTSGDLQWNTFNFKYGTVVIRQKLFAQSTKLWAGEWLLGVDCQSPNKYTGDTGAAYTGTCPGISAAGYDELDILETKANDSYWGNTWGKFGGADIYAGGATCGFAQAPLDTNFHVYAYNWTPTTLAETIDGVSTGCGASNKSPTQQNMFFIMQTQTSTDVTGAPVGLPQQFLIDYVKVCSSSFTSAQCVAAATNDANVIFYDDFNATGTAPAPPTGLTADVK